MIDRTEFTRRFSVLLDRFGRTMGDPSIREYFEILNEQLDTPHFLEASRIIFANDQFFPAPVRFLEAVGVDPASEAEVAWNRALDEASRGVAYSLDTYDPAHAFALRAVGSNRAIGLTPTDRLPFLKREFIAAYKQHRERGSLPELDKPEPVELPPEILPNVGRVP